MPLSPLSVLVSARDPAGALQAAALCRQLAGDPRFALTLVSQAPATALLQAQGLAPEALPQLTTTDRHAPAAQQVLDLADRLLGSHRPDVLLCGLSSPREGGIDEALLARRNCPALLLQDFWGEQNDFFGRSADVAAVLDDRAAALTRQRHGMRTVVTGSPRHEEYRTLPVREARQRLRARPDASRYIGFFGQPLHAFEGYRRTIVTWAAAGAAMAGTHAFYRPHPRESDEQVASVEGWLREGGLDFDTLRETPTEHVLAACDAACAVFSNCAYDAAFLNYFSDAPLVTPVLLLYDAELVAFLGSTGDSMKLPYVTDGLALAVWEAQGLPAALESAVAGAGRAATWQAARTRLPDPGRAAALVASELLRLGGRPAG
jgi:hypothetical protein